MGPTHDRVITFDEQARSLLASVEGLTECNIRVKPSNTGASDRKRLERLCRYMPRVGARASSGPAGGLDVRRMGRLYEARGSARAALGRLRTDQAVTIGVEVTTLGVSVVTGSGKVTYNAATPVGGDLSVVERAGDVEVNGAVLSDVKLQKNLGSITLVGVTTTSDLTIVENVGNVEIIDSTIAGDSEIKLNQNVAVSGTGFSFEAVSIIDNGAVDFLANFDFGTASIGKNGLVRIEDNFGQELKCFDNLAVSGSGNTITLLADGQCAGF